MKQLLALLLMLSCAAPSYSQPKSDAEKAGLVGRVKSVELGRIEYPLRDGRSAEGKKIPIQLTTFNEDGSTTEVTTFKEDGSVLVNATYLYDGQGRNVGIERHGSLGQGKDEKTYKEKIVYTLDERGNRVEEVGYQTDGALSHRRVNRYDEKGNKVEDTFYSWNGYRNGKTLSTYDERGNELTQTSYNADDSVSYKTFNTYDERGNKSEWVQHVGETLRYRVLYRYDEKGRLRESETFEYNAPPNIHSRSHAPVPGKVVFTYDDDKGITEEATYNAEGVLVRRVVTRTDGKGNVTGRAEFAGDGSPKHSQLRWYDRDKLVRAVDGESSTKIEYDAQGNWTRKTFFVRPKDSDRLEAHGAEYRVINYY